MVNEERQIAKNLFVKLDKSIEPFVISIMPSKKYDISVGKSEKIGDRHSITIKNIVMMQPTESMESVEFKTISERLKDCFVLFKLFEKSMFVSSFFSL